MKRRVVSLLSLLAVLLPAKAQETTYALPQTTFKLEVEAVRESFFAGPYAAYAKDLLNLDVAHQDAVDMKLVSLKMIPCVEADREARYILEGEDATLLALSAQGLVAFGEKEESSSVEWRYAPLAKGDFDKAKLTTPQKEVTVITYKMVETDTAFVRVPVEQRAMADKSLKDRASEAAETLLSLRREHINIATGNTDATFSGEALQAALKEISALEEEYLALFRGYTVCRTYKASFDVTPFPSRNQRYLAFRLSPSEGPVEQGIGIPYYMELEPEALQEEEEPLEKKKGKGPMVHYRVPVVCKVTVTEDGKQLLQARVPVYQLGKEATVASLK